MQGIFKLYGYGCEPNYKNAINWFEQASGLGPSNIQEKAKHAAKEIHELLEMAHTKNENIMNSYQQRQEVD